MFTYMLLRGTKSLAQVDGTVVAASSIVREIEDRLTMAQRKTSERNSLRTERELAKLKGLTDLSLDQLDLLADRIKVRRFEKRSVVYSERESGDNVYVIRSGIAKLTCLNKQNERILLEILGPGDVVGIPSLLPDIRHNLRCEAFVDCQIGLISPAELVEKVMGLPFDPFRSALKLTVGRWWQLLVRQSHFIDQTLEEKIIIALLDLGYKFGVQDVRGTILNVRLTHQDLAELVGGSRPKVTAYLGRLEAEGALTRERRSIIVAPNKLRMMVLP